MAVVIWASTAFLQVPRHRAFGQGFDRSALERLVRSNWLRTGLWTARSGLVVGMLARTITV